jgi:ubiquinone biosynthesis protein COQ9
MRLITLINDGAIASYKRRERAHRLVERHARMHTHTNTHTHVCVCVCVADRLITWSREMHGDFLWNEPGTGTKFRCSNMMSSPRHLARVKAADTYTHTYTYIHTHIHIHTHMSACH